MIVIGYDEWEVTVIDASYGKSWSYPIKEFLRSWKVLGNMAVTVSGRLPSDEDLSALAIGMDDAVNSFLLIHSETMPSASRTRFGLAPKTKLM